MPQPLRLQIETTDTEIIITQFDATECIEGALDGNTFGNTELGDGVRGVTCQRSDGAGPEVQALVFSKDNFDETSATEWATSNEFAAHLQRRNEHIALARNTKPRCYDMTLSEFRAQTDVPATVTADTPGEPANPDAPKVSEGMDDFRMKVSAALNERGWTIFGAIDPPFDFVLQELFNDFVIVVDSITGLYYKIPVTIADDGSVELGEPEETDIAFVPAGSDPAPAPDPAATDPTAAPATDQPMAAADRYMRFRSEGALVLKRREGTKRPTFEMCIGQTGWSADGRYMTKAAAQEAVKNGVFDGVPMNIQHPDNRTGKRPGLLSCAFVKPGTVRLEPNKAGGFDFVADVCTLNTSEGKDIAESFDASLETGKPTVGCSMFSKSGAWQYEGDVDGRPATIIARIDKIDAVDFVDSAAFPRATVRRRLAAHKQSNTGSELSMKEREELEQLRRTNEEQGKKLKRLTLESAVETELGKSDLPDDEKALIRPIMLSIDNPDLRTAQLKLHSRNYWRGMKRSRTPNDGSNDGGGGNGKPAPLRADVQALVNKATKAAGVDPKRLEAAQREVVGEIEDDHR